MDVAVFSLCQSGFAPREAWMSAVQANTNSLPYGQGELRCRAGTPGSSGARPHTHQEAWSGERELLPVQEADTVKAFLLWDLRITTTFKP